MENQTILIKGKITNFSKELTNIKTENNENLIDQTTYYSKLKKLLDEIESFMGLNFSFLTKPENSMLARELQKLKDELEYQINKIKYPSPII